MIASVSIAARGSRRGFAITAASSRQVERGTELPAAAGFNEVDPLPRQRSSSAVRTSCALYGIGTSRATALSATGSALANTKASTSRTARSNASSIPSACTAQGRRRQPNQSAERWPFSAARKGKLQLGRKIDSDYADAGGSERCRLTAMSLTYSDLGKLC